MSLGSTSHVNLPILVVIQLFHSFSSCAYRKNDLFVDTNLQQSEGQRVCTATDGSLFLFCLLYFRRLTTTFSLSVSLLWHVLDHFRHSFKADVLPTCDIFDHLKDRLVAQARQFPFPWQCWLHMNTGSDWHTRTERVLLSQHFINKNRSCPLQTSMN